MSEPFFFTWSAQRGAAGQEITGGRGEYFTTADGRRWLDLASLSYQASLGHGHPRMIAAVQAQAGTLCLASPTAVFPAKRELAAGLLRLCPPGFTKVFFTLGGAEAIENAMKIARLVTGRHKFISRYRSYHGATFGALSLTGDFRRPPVEPGLAGVARVLDDRHIADTLAAEGGVAAVVLEAVPGANGVFTTPAHVWAQVRAACDREGALLCVDEVLTGFGRTGTALGLEHFGVEPDLICVGKGLTAGYAPLGAVLVHERVAARFEDEVLWAGLTNYGHPLGCAAGREALAVYAEDGLFSRAAMLAPQLVQPLEDLAASRPEVIRGVRGLGLLAAVDVELDHAGVVALASELERRAIFLHLSARRKTAIFAPPLIISEAALATGMAAFAEAVTTVRP